MEVVKKGKKQGEKVKCTGNYNPGKLGRGCGSILRVVSADVKKWDWQYFDEFGTDYWVVCPECEAKTKVNPRLFGL